jgi:nucleolar protein 56
MDTFSSIMRLKAFSPFTNAESALENLNRIKNNEISEDLSNFLASNLKKKKGFLFNLGTTLAV